MITSSGATRKTINQMECVNCRSNTKNLYVKVVFKGKKKKHFGVGGRGKKE